MRTGHYHGENNELAKKAFFGKMVEFIPVRVNSSPRPGRPVRQDIETKGMAGNVIKASFWP